MLLRISRPPPPRPVSASSGKIKINFCGVKWSQWPWIQLHYHNLEITLAEVLFRLAEVLNCETHIIMWEMKQVWTQGPLDIPLNIKEGFLFLLSENRIWIRQVIDNVTEKWWKQYLIGNETKRGKEKWVQINVRLAVIKGSEFVYIITYFQDYGIMWSV